MTQPMPPMLAFVYFAFIMSALSYTSLCIVLWLRSDGASWTALRIGMTCLFIASWATVWALSKTHIPLYWHLGFFIMAVSKLAGSTIFGGLTYLIWRSRKTRPSFGRRKRRRGDTQKRRSSRG